MTKPKTVIDKDGKQAEREDGILLDGDVLRVPVLLTDGKPSPNTIYVKDNAPASPATLASAATILGDSYDEAALARLSDQAARHAVVKKRIGSAADGRSTMYLDAAWGALSGTPVSSSAPSTEAPSMPVLTDAQRAHAAQAVERAIANAGKPAQRRGGPMTDAERKAGDERLRGAYAVMCADMSNAWKSQAQRGAEARPVTLDARTEAAFHDGRIADTPNARAYAEMKQTLSDGWKENRK